MSNKRFRQLTRWGHIIEGVLIFLYIYSSTLAESAAYTALIQFVVVPLIVISGLAMWQQPRLMKWLRGNNRQTAAN